MSDMQKLRNQLRDTMEGLKTGAISVTTANAMSGVAQVLLNSLKVELDVRKAAGDQSLLPFVGAMPRLIEAEEEDSDELTEDQRELLSLLPPEESAVTIHSGDKY